MTVLSEDMGNTLLKLMGSELSGGMLGSDAVERERHDGPPGSTDSGSPQTIHLPYSRRTILVQNSTKFVEDSPSSTIRTNAALPDLLGSESVDWRSRRFEQGKIDINLAAMMDLVLHH